MRNPKALGLSLVVLLAIGAGALAPAAGATKFTASSYPATFTGTSAAGNDEFKTEAGNVECASHFTGSLSEASETATVTPTYSSCKAFGFASATFTMNGCDYVFHTNGEVAMECPEGKKAAIAAGSCEAQIGTQTGLKTVDLSNGSGDILVQATVTGIAYTVTKDGFLCPFAGTGAKTGGSYGQNSAVTVQGTGGQTLDIGTGATATSVTTSLSGEGKSGEAITVNEGAKVKDQATLSGTNAFKATGTVEYRVYADSECKELVTTAGKVTVTSGSVPASSEVELTAGAVYYWQAVYSGDANNLGSSSVCGKGVLTVKAATSLTTSLTGGGESGPEIEIEEGVGVTDKATLSGTNVSKAGGTVEYSVYSDSDCTELVTGAGKVTVSGGSVPSSNEVKLSGGLYFWQAVYSGDATHTGATGACRSEIQIVAEATSLTTSLVGGGESGVEIDVPEGTPVNDTATLSGTNASEASGNVRYDVYADNECTELVAEAGIVFVEEGEVPPSHDVLLPAGTYYWQAEYSGDSLNQRSRSVCGVEIEHVETYPLTTSLSGEGESGVEIEVEEETPVTDTATLNTENAATATGTAEYNVYADDECTELVAEAGEVSVLAGNIPASNPVTLPPGIYYWQATYSGDITHAPATSVCGVEIEIVAEATTVTTSLSGEEESGKEIEVQEGAGVSDSAVIGGTNSAEATGVVEYNVYEDSKCEELVAEAGSVEVSGGIAPKSEEIFLPAGTYYWQAVYSGDTLNHGSVSPCGVEVLKVEAASLTVDLTGGGQADTEIYVGPETPVAGSGTLAIENASTATGTVEYNVYTDSKCTELAKEVGEVTVSEGNVPASPAETLSEGTYYWQAVYSGDKTHSGGTSICGKAMQKVDLPWIVSVGDSFVSGEGGRWAGNTDDNIEFRRIDALGSMAYKNPLNGEEKQEAIPLCHRSISAEIFIRIPAVRSKNLACSGAETLSRGTRDSFTPGLDFINEKKNGVLNKTKELCSLNECKGQALLLEEFAKAKNLAKEDIKMVVVSIGGNDFGFGKVVTACVKAWLVGGECSKQPEQTSRFEEPAVKTMRERIEGAINDVGKAMDNAGFKKADYTILVQDYPSPLPEAAAKIRYPQAPIRRTSGGCPIKDNDAEWANKTALKKINETVKKAYEEVSKAGKYTLKFMELENAFDKRRLCETGVELVGRLRKHRTWRSPTAVDKTEWVNQVRAVSPVTPFEVQESVHPNYWGQLALRNCVRRAYNNGVPKGGTCLIEAEGRFAPPGAPPPGKPSRRPPRAWDWEPRMKLEP